ncbi:MAG TPA: hypothetical protein VKE88_01205, partial [Candidatus Nanoarchaeia archaeon]|nr:hypothetical protein [Candidatus Nanoarchaeia archaeon]
LSGTAKAEDVSKTAKPKVPMNIALYGEALARGAYHMVNEGSKTTQGTSVLDMSSQGTLIDADFRGKLGANLDNKHYVFVPVEVAMKMPDMANSIAGVGSVGGVNGSSLDLGFGLGYGRNFGNHKVALSVLMDMYQEALTGKHDIINFTQDNNASDIAAVLEYALNSEKGKKVFEARYKQNVANLGGESKTTVTIPSFGMTLPTQTGKLTKGGMSLEATVFVPVMLDPFITGKLDTVFQEVDTAGTLDTKNYTKLGVEAGATAYRKGNFSIDALVGYGAITSGLVNESALNHSDLYGRLGMHYAYGQNVDFTRVTPTVAVDEKSNTATATVEPTPVATPEVKKKAAVKPKAKPKATKPKAK